MDRGFRSWNSAASDDMLWRAQYDAFFGNYEIRAYQTGGGMSSDWREVFKRKYRGIVCFDFFSHRVNHENLCFCFNVILGISKKNLTSGRGYCGNCKTIVWDVNMRCPNENCNRQIKLVSLSQVLPFFFCCI